MNVSVLGRRRVLFALLTCAAFAANAQESIISAVRALDDQERIAALGRDLPALHRLWSEQFAVNAPNNQVVVGKQAILDKFVRSGVINFSRFERSIEFARVDGDIVTLMGLETLQPVSDAPAAGLRAGQITTRRFTNIWKREGDAWRLFIRHANVITAP
jgi:ketosteroid isomerase-like protein